jgi:hypothetical protein
VSKFVGDLVVKLVKDDASGLWELTQPLVYQSDLLGKSVTVPAGFKTDFCSVPRIPFAFDLLGNRARMSGCVHDFLYTAPHLTDRKTADCVLKEMLQIDGVNDLEAEMFYLAVRVGAASHW